MHNIRNITNNLYFLGCSDRKIPYFEGVYPVKDGMSYNSYLLKDEKNVLFDTVDQSCGMQFLNNLEFALNGEKLDYIIIHHMEPDHCALLKTVIEKYPEIKIVCTSKAITMIQQFFDLDFSSSAIIVKEGDTLKLGKHELEFLMAPMVHWPEVMVTYDKTDKILFTADAFGSFGALNGNIYDDEIDFEKEYIDEARRYYTNIVGKYGMQVQMLLKKASQLDIKMLCPLHGVLVRKNINLFVEKYNKWSTYTPEINSVLIAYSSIYGGTETAVNIIANKLAENNIKNIKIADVSLTHPSFVLSEAFKYSHIIIATTTYNTEIFETMETFLNTLIAHNLQNRKYVIVQNGSWAPTCGKKIEELILKLKGSEIIDNSLCIKSTIKEDQLPIIDNVVGTIVKSLTL